MTSTSFKKTSPTTAQEIPLQGASWDIWDKKYRLKDKHGNPVDQSLDDTFMRVAKATAAVEKTKAEQDRWTQDFFWALQNGAIPAGRITSNAGAEAYKPATSTINCTVSGIIEDSMDGILSKVHEAGLTLKAGCGIGYEFSTLRPSHAYVSGAGAYTSGPLSFMDIFDKMCCTISSAGGRRGAQMGTFDVSHPDVLEFIRAKREDGRLRQFNLSLLISEEFINAVKEDAQWPLSFPATAKEVEADNLVLNDREQIVWRDSPFDLEYTKQQQYILNDNGQVACRVYKYMRASRVWDVIMASTYDFAEPGFILIDRVNEMNNNWFCEHIRATNPCGEQPLPPYGACLLGSINLTKFIDNAFSDQARFDWDRFRKVVAVFTRLLDNVVEINGLPLEEQRQELMRKRRHGMGFLGLGSALAMLGIRYGGAESVAFTEETSKQMALQGWRTGVELAEEKGPAPIMDEEFEISAAMLAKRPEMVDNGIKVGDKVKGKVLHALYSRYMQQIGEEEPELIQAMIEKGCRFTHHTSIAPTGTISLSIANNVSNGIEPSFSHKYMRNIITEGKKSKMAVDVYSFEMLAYRSLIDGSVTETDLPDYFTSSEQVLPSEHVDIQAAAQRWIDSSISKTINVATDISYEEFKGIYLYAHSQGLKGCTTFRFNPEAFQGVLVKEKDLENTQYEFTLEDGSTVTFKGNDHIDYDGEEHTAANLFEALKEGYYGKL
ncbi:MAG: ribonucleoside-diphosphate reductase alpha chain [Psychromonas sp.]|jgi:ribonucleoside-diphosphate reductase alpha chain|uniref:adenosylcobalamin-dependent ribonucleoside-diphosphate reductase n=1 Tax=Psychromonas sp. TaxID=1884585 RepID=UPI0039E2BD21